MSENNQQTIPEEMLLQAGFGPKRGKLRVFFGFAAGVGKTYTMLTEAHECLLMGKNVVIGYIEPHKRPDTNRLLEGLPQVPLKQYQHKQLTLYEPDIDRLIQLKPDIVLIDELAHTNPIGARNKKRYQDVDELLNAGITVYTTINVQHIESLNDIVEKVTEVEVRETVPDTFFQHASLRVVDVEPDELIDRLEQGKIYADENAKRALKNFFTPEKLDHLRGLAIQKASNHINQMNGGRKRVQSKLLTIIDDRLPKMAEKCIRWTARLAQGVGDEWTVIQVRSLDDTPTEVPLAERLGAEVINIEADDSFETIVEYAKMTGASDIIMGKKVSQKWFQKLFVEDLEDRLIRRLDDIEIHLIPFKEKMQRPRLTFSQLFEGGGRDFTLTFGLIMLATLVTEGMQYLHFGDQNLMLVYIFFVLLVARYTSGYLWSAMASIISVLSYNWFFVEPLYSLTVYKAGYPITLVIMLIVALMISNLMVRLKTQAENAKEKEHQMEILYELNKQYMETRNEQEIYESTTTYLARLLQREVALYDREGHLRSLHSSRETLSQLTGKDEKAVAFWVVKNQKEAGRGTDTLIGANGFYLPIVLNGKPLGALGVERNEEHQLANSQLNYLRLVITQIATVFEQVSLASEKEQIQLENEREKVRSNLLRAVSHDLRTPLTTISGIAETLSETEGVIKKETKQKLLGDIQSESQWLIRMVENLLSVTRINLTNMAVKRSEEPIEEIIEAVLTHLKKVYPQLKIIVKMPDQLIFVQVDPILIEQALFNLIENGVRHGTTDTPIFLRVSQEQDVVIEIENQGEIPLGQYQKIQANLTNDTEVPVDSKNGLGIGLSIVKTIIHAHEGKLAIETKAGSTIFRIYLKQ
ncbi:sensor histidine kinase [Enterococcus casseliflavus]|uniref:sensor histidine kinase n=1 Tax=Enterococcus casseliflavus TaxID=37734 RepID=UPI001BCF5BAF|nr:sensor histidine kinase KdpD [Enterococcus casseliflavus]